MTTAHRPTWAPARGGEEQGGTRIFAPSRQVSAKNQAAHTKLKFRQEGQSAPHELKDQDLKAQLEAKERQHFQKTKGIAFEEERKNDLLLLEAAPVDDAGGNGSSRALIPNARDADDVDADASSDGSSDEDDDSDDEAELKAELERIRAERAAEADKRAAEGERKRQEAIRAEVLGGNPLVQAGGVDFGVKRRWDEDVVFKNQTRGEVKATRRFINDTVRSDFHRRFLERYIR
eukprot:GHRR01004757.1.p1 GENE.GHRR01004757.1~~GHRR01004757.1.p1  ORF type:complete len:233 (+),score=66.31 GHRR01004757.1:293-991(+)